jgi:hypothetical protein
MKTCLFTLLLTLLLLAGCGLFNTDPKKPTGELVPLAVGNYWDYHRWYLSPNIADTIREEILSEHTFMVGGTEQKMYGYQKFYPQQSKRIPQGSSLLAFLENEYGSSPAYYKGNTSEPEYEWLRANGENGLLSFGGISPADTLILKNLQYRYPGRAGEQQEFPTLSYSFSELQFSVQDTIAIETLGTNETFESEWATYKGCYVYRFQEVGKEDAVYIWDHYVYIKPGIGVVAVETIQVTSDIPNDKVGQWVLIDYQLDQ